MIETYKLKLKTLTNLHIGSSFTAQTFDYYIEKNQFFFIDEDKLMNTIIEKNLEDRFIIALNSKNNSDRNLKSVLNQIGINNHFGFVKYVVNGKLKLNKKNLVQLTPVEKFIRNGNGDLYIPGSSIKGYIANILNLDKESGNKISISDSKVISDVNLFISTVSYFSEYYSEHESKLVLPKDGQSNYVEFLKPHTEIEFLVNIDTNYINLDNLNNLIKKSNRNYYNKYLSFFEQPSLDNKYAEVSNDYVMHLGKYTNFLLKTNFINEINKEEILFDKVKSYRAFPKKFKEKLIKKSDEEKIFPLALKLSYHEDGKYYENGLCAYEFEEL